MTEDQDRKRIETLAAEFPCLRGKPGVLPWDAPRLDAWAASRIPSHGERVTAQFVLAVWNHHDDWESGRCDIMDALGVWDEPHREAFLSWARNPWWL